MSDEKKELYFRIFRFNPDKDQTHYFDEYKVSLEKGTTILRAIHYIKDNMEPKLAYRFYCQAGICGSCAVKVNGVSKLACTTQVWDELENTKEPNIITIEPLSNFKVMRDMIIDYDPVISKLEKYQSWVTPDKTPEEFGKKEYVISEEDFKVIEPATDCILCAACYSECSIMDVNKDFISPLVILKSYRMNNDSRDVETLSRLKLVNKDHGVWDCTHCYRCVEACVKDIPIMDAIHGLRNESFKRNLKNTEGYRHAAAFEQDIKSTGRLNEATIILKTKGLFGAMSMIPFSIKMALKGRVPNLIVKKIPGIKSVRRILSKIK